MRGSEGCLALVLPVLAQISALYDLSWHVIAAGGGKMESAQHTLHGTVGQALTGQMSSSGHALCSGFWCGVAAVPSLAAQPEIARPRIDSFGITGTGVGCWTDLVHQGRDKRWEAIGAAASA